MNEKQQEVLEGMKVLLKKSVVNRLTLKDDADDAEYRAMDENNLETFGELPVKEGLEVIERFSKWVKEGTNGQ